jgi:dipeptidyl aminopeptidase/acylaminoacyl peptidase
MTRSRANRPAYLAALVAAVLLVACADVDTGPQFATDPRPTRAPTQAVSSPSPALLPTAASIATPASFTDLLGARGAVSTVYVASGSDAWSVSSGGDATRVFAAPDGSQIRAMDSSPDGQNVAILLDSSSNGRQRSEVILVDAAGSIVDRVEAPDPGLATPVAGVPEGRHTVDWSPQGDKVLVQFGSGNVVEIPTDKAGPAIPLDFDDAAGAVVAPAWSPTGQSIAFIAESDDGETRSLRLLDTRTGQVATVVTSLAGRLVVDFAWLPDGVSLLFTEGGVPGSAISGIDLWQVGANGENRALVASAGTVAPVARIANLSPSPDGRSVAYAVLVPGSGRPAVDSVWVRSLGSGIGFRIPLPSVASVEDIWWTDEGLVVSVVTTGTAQGRPPTRALLQVKRDGSMAALWAAPTAVATPTGATPAAIQTSN